MKRMEIPGVCDSAVFLSPFARVQDTEIAVIEL
jgi:hypothetical protein